MNRRIDLIDLATTPEPQRDYVGHLSRLCDTLGVEHASYFAANPISGKMHGFTTYPEEWKSHYVAHRLQEVDPTLNSASRSVAPVDWKRLKRDPNYDRVFKDANDFKLPFQGVTVPIRGMFGEVGLLCACSSATDEEWTKLRRNIIGSLLNNAVHLHDTVMNSDPLPENSQPPKAFEPGNRNSSMGCSRQITAGHRRYPGYILAHGRGSPAIDPRKALHDQYRTGRRARGKPWIDPSRLNHA